MKSDIEVIIVKNVSSGTLDIIGEILETVFSEMNKLNSTFNISIIR